MIPDSLLSVCVVLGVAAASADPSARRDNLTRISQRLAAGESAAIDDLLACTRPVAEADVPSAAEIERLRRDVERLRAASSVSATSAEARPASPKDVEASVREARAWLRAGDPDRGWKALSSIPGEGGPLGGEVAYWRACALEQLGRDAEALEQFRKAADGAPSPVLKQAAASGVDHVEWRISRVADPEAKP